MSTMPEFEMPAAVAPPPRRDPVEARGDEPLIDRLTVESDAPIADPLPSKQPVVWRHLVIAGLVGALVGAAVPAAVQGLERAAAAAHVDSLRAVATDYLTAIAERRADDATALVPLPSGRGADAVSPQAVLAAAQPIERTEVRLVHTDGDVGTVEVRYRAGLSDVSRTLDAERVGGAWRLLTSLAERVNVHSFEPGPSTTLAGVSLTDRNLHLYPGDYAVDRVQAPVFHTSAERFSVDGDPRTPTDVFATIQLVAPLRQLAEDHAEAAAVACQAAGDCQVPDGALLGTTGQVHVNWSDPEAGTVELVVPLVASVGSMTEWLDMRVRMTVDDDGRPLAWECGRPGEYDGELAPCPSAG